MTFVQTIAPPPNLRKAHARSRSLLSDQAIHDVADSDMLARYKPGDKVPVTLLRGGHSITITVTLAPPQVFDYRIEEDPQATPQAKALRVAWLSGK